MGTQEYETICHHEWVSVYPWICRATWRCSLCGLLDGTEKQAALWRAEMRGMVFRVGTPNPHGLSFVDRYLKETEG